MPPCTDFSSCFCMESFYFYWRETVCILFPLESTSMYSISSAYTTKEKNSDPGTNPFGKDSSLKVMKHYLPEREIGCDVLLFQLRYTSGCCSTKPPVPMYASFWQVQMGMTSVPGASQAARSGVKQATHCFSCMSTEKNYYSMAHKKYGNW